MKIGLNVSRHCFGQNRKEISSRLDIVKGLGFEAIRENNPGQGQYPALEPWFAWWLPSSDEEIISIAGEKGLEVRWQLTNNNEGVELYCSTNIWDALTPVSLSLGGSRQARRINLIAGAILTPWLPSSASVLAWLSDWHDSEIQRLSKYKNVVFEAMNLDVLLYSNAQEAALAMLSAEGSDSIPLKLSAITKFAKNVLKKFNGVWADGLFDYEGETVGFGKALKGQIVTEMGIAAKPVPGLRMVGLINRIQYMKTRGVKEVFIHTACDASLGENSKTLSNWAGDSIPNEQYAILSHKEDRHLAHLLPVAAK